MTASPSTLESGSGLIAALDAPRTDVVVYTRAWVGDHQTIDDEQPTAQLSGRIFVDGHEIVNATGLTMRASASDFLEADIHIAPSTLRVVPLNEDDWKALDA